MERYFKHKCVPEMKQQSGISNGQTLRASTHGYPIEKTIEFKITHKLEHTVEELGQESNNKLSIKAHETGKQKKTEQ